MPTPGALCSAWRSHHGGRHGRSFRSTARATPVLLNRAMTLLPSRRRLHSASAAAPRHLPGFSAPCCGFEQRPCQRWRLTSACSTLATSKCLREHAAAGRTTTPSPGRARAMCSCHFDTFKGAAAPPRRILHSVPLLLAKATPEVQARWSPAFSRNHVATTPTAEVGAWLVSLAGRKRDRLHAPGRGRADRFAMRKATPTSPPKRWSPPPLLVATAALAAMG